MAPKKKIPDRWLDYCNIKDVIPDARLVAFKTPLPHSRFELEPIKSYRWTTFDLMDYVHQTGWELGLVIDFTYKFPAYYEPDDFIREGVQFIKLGCVGHDIPDENVFLRFCDVIDGFLHENRRNNRVIGVHCTHGVNRTGYMVCRYLIQKLGYHPDQAIRTFAEARGHPLERENYLQALHML